MRINVIDLDKTLIPFDSFRRLLIRSINRLDPVVIWLCALRVCRVISLEDLKYRTTSHLMSQKSMDYFQMYAQEISKHFDEDVLEMIDRNSDSETVNIILSASPDAYVQFLKVPVNWVLQGSFCQSNKYHHLFGPKKIDWVQKFYPREEFEYNFCISDSESDIDLLELFQRREIFKKNR